MWDLSPRPGIEPAPPAFEAQNLKHWVTREVPGLPLLRQVIHSGKWMPILFFKISKGVPWWLGFQVFTAVAQVK